MRSNALRRGIDWRLTYEDFLTWLWGAPCGYCGDASTPTGIDRFNNELFYDLSNAYSCCPTCNQMKGRLPASRFLTHVLSIANTLGPVANAAIALKGQS
jgi:hypothetical protein